MVSAIHKTVCLPSPYPVWQRATWEDYLAYRDGSTIETVKLFFNNGYLWAEMGGEGINHATVSRLFTMLFAFWFTHFPEQIATELGGCQIENPGLQAVVPDLVLYLGADVPRWQAGESRYIDLTRWRVPNLVGEIADTTLATDLDEKKQIYLALGVPEYWVIDVQGQRVLAFRLQSDGHYQQVVQSIALPGLAIPLLEEALQRLEAEKGSNIRVAGWFAQAIANLEPQRQP